MAGTPIGTPQFCASTITTKVEKMIKVAGAVEKYSNDSNIAYAMQGGISMLRMCVMPRLTHIARTVLLDPRPALMPFEVELPLPTTPYNNEEARLRLRQAEDFVFSVFMRMIQQEECMIHPCPPPGAPYLHVGHAHHLP